MTVPSDQQRTTLSSTIEPVIEENQSVSSLSNVSDNIQSTETNSANQSNDTAEEKIQIVKKNVKNIIIIKSIVVIVQKLQIQK